MHIIRNDWVYFNDFDEGACAWLAELMKQGHIPPGEIDRRSILDVSASDLRGFRQCHFFAGIGGWAYALRLAGVPVDVSLWTGSPPCQPFSVAGRQKGRDDERHLAPHFVDLVRVARPGMLLGEQVASAEVFGKAPKRARENAVPPPDWAWIDDLLNRLEAARYTAGANDFPSAGVGAPHIRQRTYFGAVAHEWLEHASRNGRIEWGAEPSQRGTSVRCGTRGLADLHGNGCSETGRGQPEAGCDGPFGDSAARGLGDCLGSGLEGLGGHGNGSHEPGRIVADATGSASEAGAVGGLADNNSFGWGRWEGSEKGCKHFRSNAGWFEGNNGIVGNCETGDGSQRPGPTNGFWGTADWLFCRDERWRPVESGAFEVAHGLPEDLGHLRLERDGEDENGQEGQSGTGEILQDLWDQDDSSTVQRSAGRPDGVQEAALLQSGLHGCGLRGHDQGVKRQEQSSSIGQDAESELRNLWEEGSSRSPSGREPSEQRSGEFAEPLRFLSQEGTPPNGSFPLASGVRHRVELLRGYGNAINPQAAAQFIQAFFEALENTVRAAACEQVPDLSLDGLIV